jgi:mitochondrial chaperone BCS1
MLSLSTIGMDDTTLNDLVSELPQQCILLMEDIDAALNPGITRDLNDDDATSDEGVNKRRQERQQSAPQSTGSRVTLSGVLNALDGISAQEGRILYATTNIYSALDPALCRPGRMDLHIQFKLASKYQIRELFKSFYLPSHVLRETEDTASEEDVQETSAPPQEQKPFPETTFEDRSCSEQSEAVKMYVGIRHRADGPALPRCQIFALAERFADAIPEHEFSMAALQGYLMLYKTRPAAAISDALAWVERERADKARKAFH